MGGVPSEGAQDQRVERRRDIGGHLGGRRHPQRAQQVDRLHVVRAEEQALAAEELVQDDAHGEDVRAAVDLLALQLLERYLEPLATRTRLREHIRTSARVTGIGRVGFDKVKTAGRAEAPFELRYRNGAGDKTLRADAVIDASGTWFAPNPAGANGLPVDCDFRL
jgi:hypothetical protein